jgi:hypothetical protein
MQHMSPMTPDQIRTALAAAGARRQRAIKADLKARAEKVELLRLGLGVLQLQEMHQLAGVSRDFIHRTVGLHTAPDEFLWTGASR